MENAGNGDLCLFIEPYGEDFYLKPGEVFTITPEAEGADVWSSTLVWEGGITVWLYENGDPTRIVLEYTVTDADGIQLECGHQRPSKSAGSDVAEREVSLPVTGPGRDSAGG
ncbi:hypothetical protein AMK18_23925 [Streptomyces sp. CB01249]|nr:hypothetical protein AMK18_23925 [Streptomyces sp. CB01249]